MPQRVQAVRFSPDGAALLVGGGTPGDYGEAALVPTAGGNPKVLDTWSDLVLAVAFSREGRLAAVGAADGSVRLYDAASGKRLWGVRMHSDWVTGVAFSGDGKYVASSSKDMTVKVYEIGSGALFTTYNGHNRQLGKYRGQNPVYAVAFSADSPAAVSAGGGTWLQVWEPEKARDEAGDAGDMEERFMKPSHARYLAHGFQREVLALLLREGKLLVGGADGTVKEFEFLTGKELRTYREAEVPGADPGQADWLFALDLDLPGKRLATGSYRGEIRLWSTDTGRLLKSFPNQPRMPAARRE
jgi:WD40 repeat protein